MPEHSAKDSPYSCYPEAQPFEPQANRDFPGGNTKIVCGPLLRYWGLDESSQKWKGSVTYVFEEKTQPIPETGPGNFSLNGTSIPPFKFWQYPGYSFWRYDFVVDLTPQQQEVTYALEGEHKPFKFYIPGTAEEANILFFSCNGFSLGTPTDEFPNSMWADVLDKQAQKPFNYALGGGDQLYCDSITEYLPVFEKWTKHNLTHRGFQYQPNEKETEGIHIYYLRSYIDWFGRGYWKGTNGKTLQPEIPDSLAQIPQLNIYDDHDIIDGFGSYNTRTQRTPMFEIVGNIAFIYYCLFQLNIAPDKSTNDPKRDDPSWIMINRNGPYMHHPARSIWAQLGKSVGFLGLDCRTERTQHTIVTQNSYDAMFSRMEKEVGKNPNIRHLVLMLGVPIAYPRMVWAEALMSSAILKPVKWLARHKIILSGFVNEFDGQVELLDDLSDHWCAKPHKKERNRFLLRLQDFSKRTSVRVTILAGDVHLCGMGRFRNRDEKVKPEQDYRYMICPISSAITNAPPPSLLADFMNKRNKNHYLGEHTVEDMVHLFQKDTDGTSRNNECTLARRNFCTLAVDPNLNLDTTLFVEKEAKAAKAVTVPYEVVIPPLNLNTASSS